MSTEIIVGILVLVVVAVILVAVFMKRPESGEQQSSLPLAPEHKGDVLLVNEQGQEIIHGRELADMPQNVDLIEDDQSRAVTRAKKLAEDVFQDTMKMPNKIVEITVDPIELDKELAQKKDTQPSKNEADSQGIVSIAPVSKSGSALQIDNGRLRELVNDASHVVSISVAQKHREIINHNLHEIKSAVDELQSEWSDQERAELHGTVKYLEYLTAFMHDLDSPDAMPVEKRNQLETIRREVMVWDERLRTKAMRLKERVDSQKRVDWLRTGKTYNVLLKHAKDVQDLIEKFDSFLRIVALLDIGTVYLDPVGKSQSGLLYIKSNDESFDTIKGTLEKLKEHSENYLSKGLFNRVATMKKRREDIENKTGNLEVKATENQNSYEGTVDSLGKHLKKMKDNGEKIRMVVEFDEQGNVRKVGLL